MGAVFSPSARPRARDWPSLVALGCAVIAAVFSLMGGGDDRDAWNAAHPGQGDGPYLDERLVALAGWSGPHGLAPVPPRVVRPAVGRGEEDDLRVRDVDMERGVLHIRRAITEVAREDAGGCPRAGSDVTCPCRRASCSV